jgi:hypothetical protein
MCVELALPSGADRERETIAALRPSRVVCGMDAREVNVFLQCLARVASTGDAVRARGVVEEVLARVAAEDGFGAAYVSCILFF